MQSRRAESVTGWELRCSPVRDELGYLERPGGARCGCYCSAATTTGAPARAHLDLASSDVRPVFAWHGRLGASVAARFEHWTVLVDPTGYRYCVTARNPDTGSLTA